MPTGNCFVRVRCTHTHTHTHTYIYMCGSDKGALCARFVSYEIRRDASWDNDNRIQFVIGVLSVFSTTDDSPSIDLSAINPRSLRTLRGDIDVGRGSHWVELDDGTIVERLQDQLCTPREWSRVRTRARLSARVRIVAAYTRQEIRFKRGTNKNVNIEKNDKIWANLRLNKQCPVIILITGNTEEVTFEKWYDMNYICRKFNL